MTGLCEKARASERRVQLGDQLSEENFLVRDRGVGIRGLELNLIGVSQRSDLIDDGEMHQVQ